MSRSAVLRSSAYESVESLPDVWTIVAQQFANVTAVYDPHAKPEIKMTYADLYQKMQQFASGLQALGIQPVPDAVPGTRGGRSSGGRGARCQCAAPG